MNGTGKMVGTASATLPAMIPLRQQARLFGGFGFLEEAGEGFVGEGGEFGGAGLDVLQEGGGGEVVGRFELVLD